MTKPTVDTFLDVLDTAVNSNTFWLSFDIANEESFEVQQFLMRQLKS